MSIIKFNPVSKLVEDTVPPPRPAREYFPDWYKKAPAFEGNTPEIDSAGVVNKSLKLCVPFMDSLSAGYIQETWQDILIESVEVMPNSFQLRYSFPTEPAIINLRDKVHVSLGDEFYPTEFTFHSPWMPELPKGWSMLYVTPFNRLDLPFHVLSGIIDSDGFTQAEPNSNMPFYVKKSFSGILPKGTPFVQMIPIKRESWESSPQPYSEDNWRKVIRLSQQYFWGGYKKVFWHKKTYK